MKKYFALLITGLALMISTQVIATDQPSNPANTQTILNQNLSNYNWMPYVNKVDKELKSNWFAPKYGEEVEVMFKISKDGTYKNLRITSPSTNKNDNQAALDAVMFASPFKPIPGVAKELVIKYNFPARNSTTSHHQEPIQVVVLK